MRIPGTSGIMWHLVYCAGVGHCVLLRMWLFRRPVVQNYGEPGVKLANC